MVVPLLLRQESTVFKNTKVRKPYTYKDSLPPNGHWTFDVQMNIDGKHAGFVYGVRNRLNGKLYIGRKYYTNRGTKDKGEETNWKTYTTSNRDIDKIARMLLHKDVPLTDLFDLVVLEEYRTIGTLSFAEVWCLVTAEVPAHRNKFYNTLINGVSWPIKEPVSSKNRIRLEAFLAGEL